MIPPVVKDPIWCPDPDAPPPGMHNFAEEVLEPSLPAGTYARCVYCGDRRA